MNRNFFIFIVSPDNGRGVWQTTVSAADSTSAANKFAEGRTGKELDEQLLVIIPARDPTGFQVANPNSQPVLFKVKRRVAVEAGV